MGQHIWNVVGCKLEVKYELIWIIPVVNHYSEFIQTCTI